MIKRVRRVGNDNEYIKIENLKNRLSSLFVTEALKSEEVTTETKKVRGQTIPRTWPACNKWLVDVAKHLREAMDIILIQDRDLAVKTSPYFNQILSTVGDVKVAKKQLNQERADVFVEGLRAGLEEKDTALHFCHRQEKVTSKVRTQKPEIPVSNLHVKTVVKLKKRPDVVHRVGCSSRPPQEIKKDPNFKPKAIKSHHLIEDVEVIDVTPKRKTGRNSKLKRVNITISAGPKGAKRAVEKGN